MDTGNDKHRLLIENLPDAFAYHQVVTDSEGEPVDYIFLEVNWAFEEMTGLSREQVKGKKATELHPGIENSRFDWIGTYGRVAFTGVSISFEQYSEMANCCYEITVYSDEPGYFAVLFRDITEGKQVREPLRKSEQRYKHLVDHAGEAIVVIQDGIVKFANPATVQTFGYSEEKLGSVPFIEFLHPEDRNLATEEYTKALSGKTVKPSYTIRVITGKGTLKWIEFNGVQIEWENRPAALGFARDITKRIQAEDELRKSEEKYRLLVNDASDVIWTTDLDLNYTYISPSGQQISGFTVEECMSMGVHNILTPSSMERVLQDIQEELELEASGEADPSRTRIIEVEQYHKDGSTVWVEIKASFLRDQDGCPCGILGITRDISDRKKVEEALKTSEERLDLAMAVKNEGCWDWNLVTNETFFDDRYYTMAGYAPNEFPQTFSAWAERVCPDDLPNAEVSIQNYLAGKSEEFAIEFRFKHKDRSWIWIQGQGKIVERDSNGSPLRMIGTHTDINERKLAEKALQNKEEQLRQITNNMMDVIYKTNIFGVIEYASPSTKQVIGYEAEEVCGKSIFEFVHELDIDYMINSFQESVKINIPNKKELRVKTKNGHYIWVESIGNALFKNGKVTGAVFTSRDISERKAAENSLNYQLKFEKIISNISSYFASLSSEEFCSGVNYALKHIGEFFQVDRSYVFQFFDDGQKMNNTHEWCAKGVEPQLEILKNVPSNTFPWWMEKLKKFENILIPDVDKMPAQAATEKNILLEQSIQSVLVVPIIFADKLIGFMGFDAVKQKKRWEKDQVTLLIIVAELISNIFTRIMVEKQIRYISFHDSTTGLYNRAYLEQEMRRLDTERQMPISIIMGDLNGLKLINDTYGHSTGDKMLIQAAEILKKSCRKEDIIARWGGDEFVILLPQTDEKKARAICKRIVNECSITEVKKIPLSMALGTAVKENMQKKLFDILNTAEDSMYKHKLAESRSTNSGVLNALLKTLEEKSYETEEHSQRMQETARKIGEKIDLPETELDRLILLVYLHDIGKITVPEEVLTKTEKLTQQDWDYIKKHPESGYRIARSMDAFVHIAEDILCHHEHWNGSGYPKGLKGTEIPLLARILAVVDAYEVMIHGRPYKSPLSKQETAAELKRCAGSQFDPELVEVFLSILGAGIQETDSS